MNTPRMQNEPETFPCLYLDGAQWEALPERLADPFLAAVHESNLRGLAALRESELAEEIRAASESEAPNSIARRRVRNCLLHSIAAWYLTRKETHLDMARAALTAACRSDQWWAGPRDSGGIRSANLATGELMHAVSFGFDALHPYLDKPLREMCLAALRTKGLAAYLEGVRLEDWWHRCDFNWNSALHGNAGIAALVVRHCDRALSDRVLGEVLEGLPHLIRAFYPDGGYIEGLMYLCTAVGHLTDFVVPYRKFSGDDLGLLSNRDFHDTITFLIEMHGGDGRAYNFSDVQEGRGGVALAQYLWWARMLGRADWTADQRAKLLARCRGGHHHGGRSRLFTPVACLWYAEPFQPAEPHSPEPLRHFKGIDWLRWRGERTWLAFRGGYNGGNHDNDDLGTFILGIDEERFLVDPGYGAIRASEHNCITVRRHEQTDGATAPIRRVEELPGGFYLDCDLQEAFPHVLEHYHRHLLLIDETLLLLDDVKGIGTLRCDVKWHFQTRLPAETEDGGFVIHGQDHTLRIYSLEDVEQLAIRPWEHRRQSVTTLEWDDIPYRVHAIQPIVLTFAPTEVTHTLTPGHLEVRIGEREFLFEDRQGVLAFRGERTTTP